MLEPSGDIIDLSILDQFCAGLMVGKTDMVVQALLMEVQNPAVITGTGIRSGLSADGDGFDSARIVKEICSEINC